MGLGHVDYSKNEAPAGYKCAECGATGVKLWREYQTVLNHQTLLCLHCACKEQDKTRTPTEDGKSLYTDEVRHWYRTADMRLDHWYGYDPEKGPPSNATYTRSERVRSDQIGWRVLAVPTEEGDTFWGYTSIPKAGCAWWYNLPALPNNQTSASP